MFQKIRYNRTINFIKGMRYENDKINCIRYGWNTIGA